MKYYNKIIGFISISCFGFIVLCKTIKPKQIQSIIPSTLHSNSVNSEPFSQDKIVTIKPNKIYPNTLPNSTLTPALKFIKSKSISEIKMTPDIKKGLEKFGPSTIHKYDYKLGFLSRVESCLASITGTGEVKVDFIFDVDDTTDIGIGNGLIIKKFITIRRRKYNFLTMC